MAAVPDRDGAIAREIAGIEEKRDRARSAPPEPVTTCRIEVPALVPDYWLYIDGRMAAAPPHAGKHHEFRPIDLPMDGGCQFWDGDGLAVIVDGKGRVEHIREGLEGEVYAARTVDLQPGTHAIGFLVLNGSGFPFAIASRDVELEPGESAEVRLPMPPGFTSGPGVAPVRLGPIVVVDWGARFEADQDYVKDRIRGLAADPVAQALGQALVGLRLAPPERPAVAVDLPGEHGGRRELDSRLVAALVRHLQAGYGIGAGFASVGGDAPEDYRDAMARLAPLVRAHDDRIAVLGEIGAILEKARR